MKYVTATVGAAFMFVACLIGGLVLTAVPPLQGVLVLPLGLITLSLHNPIWLVGPVVGIFAARHSFRSTLRRYEGAAEKNSPPSDS